jgi:hypothetical protein
VHITIHREHFEAKTDKNLLDRIRSEMSGPLKRLCVRLVSGPRGGVANEDFNPADIGKYVCTVCDE